jgi:hypothetical protein
MVPTITNPSFGQELYLPWQRRGAAIARKRLLAKETFRSGRPSDNICLAPLKCS